MERKTTLDPVALGEKLYALRNEHNLSQDELAERLNVTRQTVSNWENGKVKIDFLKANEICLLYGISLDSLLNCEEEQHNDDKPQTQKKSPLTAILSGAFSVLLFLIGLVLFLIMPEENYTSTVLLTGKSIGLFIFCIGLALMGITLVLFVLHNRKNK